MPVSVVCVNFMDLLLAICVMSLLFVKICSLWSPQLIRKEVCGLSTLRLWKINSSVFIKIVLPYSKETFKNIVYELFGAIILFYIFYFTFITN